MIVQGGYYGGRRLERIYLDGVIVWEAGEPIFTLSLWSDVLAVVQFLLDENGTALVLLEPEQGERLCSAVSETDGNLSKLGILLPDYTTYVTVDVVEEGSGISVPVLLLAGEDNVLVEVFSSSTALAARLVQEFHQCHHAVNVKSITTGVGAQGIIGPHSADYRVYQTNQATGTAAQARPGARSASYKVAQTYLRTGVGALARVGAHRASYEVLWSHYSSAVSARALSAARMARHAITQWTSSTGVAADVLALAHLPSLRIETRQDLSGDALKALCLDADNRPQLVTTVLATLYVGPAAPGWQNILLDATALADSILTPAPVVPMWHDVLDCAEAEADSNPTAAPVLPAWHDVVTDATAEADSVLVGAPLLTGDHNSAALEEGERHLTPAVILSLDADQVCCIVTETFAALDDKPELLYPVQTGTNLYIPQVFSAVQEGTNLDLCGGNITN